MNDVLYYDVPGYITKALTEVYQAMTGKTVNNAIFCLYSDYIRVLKEINATEKGLPHISMTRSLIKQDFLQPSVWYYKRKVNTDILESCLKEWEEQDKNMYVMICIDTLMQLKQD
jgi:hypothetical protein